MKSRTGDLSINHETPRHVRPEAPGKPVDLPGYEDFSGVDDLIASLTDPEAYFGPDNYEREIRAGSLRFVGNAMSLDEAKASGRERIVPLLESG